MASPISEPHPSSRQPASRQPAHRQPAADLETRDQGPWARYFNAALGAWLFISAFVWLHTPASRTNSFIVGALIVIGAFSAVTASAMRWVNALLAVWLFVSTLAIPHYGVATVWNNVVVAVLVFALSFVPNNTARRG